MKKDANIIFKLLALPILSVVLVLTLVVNQVLAATVVSQGNMNGWAFQVQSPDGSGTFVTGPDIAPLGTGSVRLFTGTHGNSRIAVHRTSFAGTQLSSVTNLDYSTFASSVADGNKYPVVLIDVTTDYGTDVVRFDPEEQARAEQPGQWQTWDTESGAWTSSIFPGFTGGTLSEYVAFVNTFSSSPVIVNRADGTGGFRLEIGPGSTPEVFDGNVDNLTINGTTYDFEPDVLAAAPPTVITSAVSGVTTSAATLNGSGNPNDSATDGWFRYDTVDPGTCDDTFGTATSPVTSLGAGTSAVAYSKAVNGLNSSTQYFYCAIARNEGGYGFGTVLSFDTLSQPAPTVITNIQTNLTSTSATLNGTANPNGDATGGWFRYDSVSPGENCNDTFGTKTDVSLLGAGTSDVAYNQPIAGLTSGSTYYYCAIAANGGGVGLGSVMSFTTPTVLADTDGDGCSDAKELGGNWRLGGQRDPNNPWDFGDVPVPNLSASSPNSPKNRAVTLGDVLAALYYVGTVDGGQPNAVGMRYNSDFNGNGIADGREYDRTPSPFPGQPWRSGPPNGSVTLQDVSVLLAQVSTNCL